MPFESKKQARFAFGTDQPWAEEWAKKTDFKKLPEKKKKKKKSLDLPMYKSEVTDLAKDVMKNKITLPEALGKIDNGKRKQLLKEIRTNGKSVKKKNKKKKLTTEGQALSSLGGGM